jgi:heme exporter protein B
MPDLIAAAPEGAADPDRPRETRRISVPAPPFKTATPSTLAGFAAVLGRELRLSLRHGADTLAALLFFVLAGALFPLAIGPAPEVLGRIAPGIVWVCALLAALLPLDRLFGADFDDGSLDQLLVTDTPASLIAGAKALSHWLTAGLPLLVAAAPLAIMLQVKPDALPALLAGLALGSATLSLLGTACAAIVLGARRGAVLLPVLVIPLSIPVLIFGTAAADAASTGLSVKPHLLLLAAFLAASLPLCPLAAGAALRAAAD